MENPSMEHMAKMAQASYQMGEKGTNKNTRVQNAQNMVNDTGYVVNPTYSNSEITTYQHKDNPKNVVIAHRGTKLFGRRGMKDIQNDLAFAIGLGGHETTFGRRKKKTNAIIKALNPEQLHMTSHSLGGGTAQHTIANSKIVRKHLTSAMTFNAAAHPVFDNDIKVSKKYKKELEDKVTHHRIKNDPVSMGFKTNVPFGKVKTHSVKHDANAGKSMLQNIVEKSTVLGRAKRFTEKGLYAHAISHFHSGAIKKKKNKK
jgi:uncharacterized protein YaaR (DUF327 family)